MKTELEDHLYKEWTSKNRISVYALAVPILGSITIGIASLIMLFWGDSSF